MADLLALEWENEQLCGVQAQVTSSAALAIAIVIFAVYNESRIRLPRWLAAVSVISYSLYLIHGPLTVLVMDRLAPSLPFTVHLVIALTVLAVVALLLWRLVEVPAQSLARRLTKPPEA